MKQTFTFHVTLGIFLHGAFPQLLDVVYKRYENFSLHRAEVHNFQIYEITFELKIDIKLIKK